MTKVIPAGETSDVTLLKEEGSLMAYCGAVTTLTFFNGPAPAEAVRERVAAVVAANPCSPGASCGAKGRSECGSCSTRRGRCARGW